MRANPTPRGLRVTFLTNTWKCTWMRLWLCTEVKFGLLADNDWGKPKIHFILDLDDMWSSSFLFPVKFIFPFSAPAEGGSLKAGTYTYPFTIRLPPFLPASYEGHHGRVMYWAKAYLDRPWKGDTECKKPFSVKGLLDLNTEPEAKVKPTMCKISVSEMVTWLALFLNCGNKMVQKQLSNISSSLPFCFTVRHLSVVSR